MDSCQYGICTITFGVISFFSLPVSFNKLEFGSWNYFLSGYSICKVNFGCIVGELSLAESPTAAMSFGCDCIVKPGRLQLSST
ncbi:hypothetical protein CMV_019214 [Castanea mollissima]|uniref:Uncharacterized protein n=1 Tax=Castanea mollissima TaxID=60419 RepID=A0A8J4QK60_9ROSI|nr:hypothetical protein CMV_019214 [Castanea mollissima]